MADRLNPTPKTPTSSSSRGLTGWPFTAVQKRSCWA
jgi:hypothetical protein